MVQREGTMLRLWIGFCLAATFSAPDAALEWKWKENDDFWVEYASEYDEKTLLAGKETNKHETFNAVFHLTVQKVVDGGSTLSVKVHKFDYSGEQTKPVTERLPGATFEVTLDKALAITRISGLDKVVREVPGAETSGEARLKFLQTVAETTNRFWLAELLLAMPNKATKPGDQWEQKSAMDVPPMGRMVMLRSLKDEGSVNDGGKDLRKIAVDMKFEWTPTPGDGGILPLKFEKIETKRSEGSTTALFDPEAGRLVKNSSKQKYVLALKLAFGGAVQDVDLEREQTHELRVLDKSPLK